LPLVIAAEHTTRIRVGTGVALALARNPMTVAAAANDLQRFSEGRMMLGLGSQVQVHITRRFSMPWSRPVAHMREFVIAMRAIWDAWNHETKLDFCGEFYSHTLMPAYFTPDPNPFGQPKVIMAAIGEQMTEIAGEVGDGFIANPFATPKYIDEVLLPAVRRGQAKSGRSTDDFEASGGLTVVTGRDESEMQRCAEHARQELGFYFTTPAYRRMLDVFGWAHLQDQLVPLAKQGKREEMAKLIDDEVLDTFTIWAEPDSVAPKIIERYAGRYDRVSLGAGRGVAPELLDDIASQLIGWTA
jgi:probable F420-dependent oxidoreductase